MHAPPVVVADPRDYQQAVAECAHPRVAVALARTGLYGDGIVEVERTTGRKARSARLGVCEDVCRHHRGIFGDHAHAGCAWSINPSPQWDGLAAVRERGVERGELERCDVQ